MKALELEGLTFAYEDGNVALEEVALSLEIGEKVAVVGPNGAGKSTLLHLIAGFRMPFDGRATVMGRELTPANLKEVRRALGLLFQDPDDQAFMPTVEEDVAFGPRNYGLDDIDGRVARALKSAAIEHLARKNPQRLSFGMKKRVAMAGIMAMEPALLLLDEPTSGLDPKARTELVKMLKGTDRTMLIATHDLEAVAEVVDRAVVLNRKVVMQGTMRELVVAKEVLAEAGLELPPVSKLFSVLHSLGYPVESLPVSMDQAVAEFTRVIDTEGKHLHAHIHEHEHAGGDDAHAHTHRGQRARE